MIKETVDASLSSRQHVQGQVEGTTMIVNFDWLDQDSLVYNR